MKVYPLFQPGLRRQLLRSHLAVAAVGLGMLVVALGSTLRLRAETLRLIDVESPIADATKHLDGGIQHSLAALRGWVALGDERYRWERQAVWVNEIQPALARLTALNAALPPDQADGSLPELSRHLDELNGSQWWVEDVARLPGNEPANIALAQHIDPIAAATFAAITGMIDFARTQPASTAQRAELAAMTDFRGWFTRTDAILHILVATADIDQLARFDNSLTTAAASLDRIGRVPLADAQQRRLDTLRAEFIAYRHYARQAIALRHDERWNIAYHLMATETAPLSRQVSEILAAMGAAHTARLAAREADVVFLSNMAIALLLGLIAVMTFVAVRIARRNSQRITAPITRLSAAAEAFAAGRLENDLPVDGEDEIASLTASFNTMRKALWDAQHHLEHLVDERTAELTSANAQLARTNRELEEFAYIASHDLQEPLRNLISYSELLRQDLGPTLPELAAEDLSFINNSADRMQRLIQALLALSQAGRADLHLERVDLGECVDRALEALASRIEETNARIQRDALPTVECDPLLIAQLYQNLIGNALKFNDGDAPLVHVTAELDGGRWVLGVRDDGIGIKPEYAEQIFAPFKRLHDPDAYEGTGIGLSLCRKVVERHRGRIWIESEPGRGAHFKFTLG